MYAFEYHRPTSVADAVSLLKRAGDGVLMAGGMTLIPTLKQRLASPSDVIDLGGVKELSRIFDATHKTVLFVTHAIEEAILLGDQVVVMTARPGRIKEVIEVDLPRPRSPEMASSPQFGALFDRVFHLIREEVTKSMQQQAVSLAETA